MSKRDVTALLEHVSFVQAEINYLSGATALVQQEIALTQQSIYHKPGFNRNWTWDHQAEVRIHGRKAPAKQYDWDDQPEAGRIDDDEPEDRPVFRDAGSCTVFPAIIEEPKPLPIVAGRICAVKRNLIDAE